ncbi:MAG TPA: PqqD family protein [Candidatus Limnocylindria bacterium]|nr:PqqD family protein [Candidatus Limnocylindria bacterium]
MHTLRRRDDISVQRIGAETVLHDHEAQRAHVVNGTAAWIWDRLDGSRSLADLGQELAEHYAVDVDTARRDVSSVVESFRQLDLLV